MRTIRYTMMLSGSLSSISKRLRNFIIRFTILLYYGELFDIPATKFFATRFFFDTFVFGGF